ncbi:membrane dipeptidase [Dyella solisilvae]|uniref:Membrane dipeptidase n=1 Tax=Dyella solisilvae TaxID=1920168 RepID=A0A370K783_9GAMM|nr:dipeptidase [Dyella solisilvae]RDI98519.1 membrane dipeptidase [Dyella solisilvae]
MNVFRTLGQALALALVLGGTARAEQDRPITLDTHVDIPFAYMHDPRFDAAHSDLLKVDLDKMKQGGLDAAFFIVYVEQGPLTPAGYAHAVVEAQTKYDDIALMIKRYPDRIGLATTPDQVRANRAAGKLSAMIGVENGYSLGHDLANLDKAYAHGARYVGLAHMGHNDLCTSSTPEADLGDPPLSDAGISDFGRSVVKRANQLGIMVDVSHSSDACVRDVLALSTSPIIASHSSSRALLNHPRNLSDDLLRAIAAKGGVIQAVAVGTYLKYDGGRELAEKALQAQVAHAAGHKAFDAEKDGYLPAYVEGMKRIDAAFPLPTVDDFARHIRHMVDVAGVDHVGIASDFDGGGGLADWNDATQTRNVTAALRRQGFSDADIAKLWSGNLLRVWGEVTERATVHHVAG